MAATKTNTVVLNNVTLTAGAGDNTTSSQDLTTIYGAEVLIKITNGASGPTVPAQCQIEISGDDTNWYEFGGPLIASILNNEVHDFAVELPITALYVRFVSGSNTDQDVTIRLELQKVTAVN